jgi:protein-tyrosine phosphatase
MIEPAQVIIEMRRPGKSINRQILCRLAFCSTFASMKILMVCLGNICRSPLAEGILEQKARALGLPWMVDSAGTNNGYHIGEAPHNLSQKVARLHSVDISGQCARAFVAEDFDRFDKIYAMSADILVDMKNIARKKYQTDKADLLLNELYPGENRDVPDPWFGEEPGYHLVYDMIDKACDKIIQKYSHRTTPHKQPI